MKSARLARCGVLLGILLAPLAAWAQAAGGLPALTSTPGAGGSQMPPPNTTSSGAR